MKIKGSRIESGLNRMGIEIIEDKEMPALGKYSISTLLTLLCFYYIVSFAMLHPAIMLTYAGSVICAWRWPRGEKE